MPKSLLIFYRDADGTVPVRDWLYDLKERNEKGFVQCVARLKLLAAEGHELRRPAADILRDGIYELRAKSGTVQYRLLYFFHGRDVIVLDHAFVKTR